MQNNKSHTTVMLIAFILALFLTTTSALAHSGRTDSKGGHKDNKNKSGLGSYHYHCGGHPAHLHNSGVCPYSNSSSTKKSAATKKPTAAPTPIPTPIPTKYIDGIEIPCYDFPVAKGTRGDAVKDIQEALIYMGYLDDTADGIYGNKTENAIIAYCGAFNVSRFTVYQEGNAPYADMLEYDGYIDERIYVCIIKEYTALLENAA